MISGFTNSPIRQVANYTVYLWFALSLAACGGSTTSPPVAQLNLAGTWSGQVGQVASGSALRLTWTAAQTGAIVSGPATLVKPAANVPATGTMTGVISGSQLTVTDVVSAGAVTGFANCAIVAAGTATATASSISGTLTLVFTSCPAASGLEPPDSNSLTLTRQ